MMRAYDTHPTAQMAMKRLNRLGPSAATIASTSTRNGKAKKTSAMRMRRLSTHVPE